MKTYDCPLCKSVKLHRDELVKHIEKNHDDEIPLDYTPYRLVYDIVNNIQDKHGKCQACGRPTPWNEKTQKYARLCGRKECYENIKETYRKRMLKVHNKIYLTDDPKHLEKMLAGRRISGTYKWHDGTKFTYTGTYEKKFLEFLDTVMEYDSQEIITPGPVLEYEYKGGKHKWITDVLILPYNLIVEVKDGGDNPNGRFMPVYRGKQKAKEVMITDQGKYHYLRLTNNNFGQFLSIIAELKMQIVDDNVGKKLFRINESTDDNIIDPYELYATKLNIYTEQAKEYFMSNVSLPLVKYDDISGIYTSDTFNEVSSFAIIRPYSNLVTKIAETHFMDRVNEISSIFPMLENTADTPYHYTGFYLDKDQPVNGYVIGITLD